MKVLKLILLVIVIIIAIPLIIALFVKKDYSISREKVINKPVAEVFDYVKLLKNQDLYSKWVMKDPTMKKEFRGTDGMVGFVYGWNSDKGAGEGEQEIIDVQNGRKLTSQLRFKRPMENTGITDFITEPVSATQTKITWGMRGTNKYPLNFMNLFMDGLLGKDIDSSLNMLKANLEK